VQNVLAAAAATWGAGVTVDSIKLGLRTFQTDEKSAPGRFNLFNIGKSRVIIDYGHNPHALRAVQGAIRQMKPRKSIGVVASPGDRRDADIQELAVVAANTFDHIIIREDEDLRGRERGEVAQLMEDTMRRARPNLPISVCLDEREASIQALEMARDGDLVVLFIDHVDEAIALVKSVGKVLSDEHQSSFFRELPRTANTGEYARIQAIADAAAQESVGSPWNGSDGNGIGRGEEVRPKESVARDGETEH
jgi:cyanophycin synthetase